MFEGKFNTKYTFCFPDFFEELEDILKAIEESTFLAVDSEFTGGFPKPLVLFSSFMNVFANILLSQGEGMLVVKEITPLISLD